MLTLSTIIGAIFGLSAAICWSFASVLYKLTEKELSISRVMVLRGILSGIFMLGFIIATGIYLEMISITRTQWTYILVATALNLGLGDYLYLMALRRLGVALTLPAAYTYPVFTTIFSFFFLHEVITISICVALAFCVSGVWALLYVPEEVKYVDMTSIRIGILLAVLASMVWSIGIILYTLALSSVSPISVTAIRSLTLAMILSPLTAIYIHRKYISFKTLVLLNVGGLFGIALGDLFFYYSIANFGPTRAAIVSSTCPLISFYIGKEYMKEKISYIQAVGAVLITAGAVIIALYS